MMTAEMTFFLSSGLPFLTEARNRSPTEPAGYLLRRAPVMVQAIMYKFLAPVLSAQFMTEATGSEFVIFSLMPLRPPLAKYSGTEIRLRDCHGYLAGFLTYLFYSLIDSVY